MKEKPDFVKRLEEEMAELQERLGKLATFMDSDNFGNLSDRQQLLLTLQANTMVAYLGVLTLRLEDLGY